MWTPLISITIPTVSGVCWMVLPGQWKLRSVANASSWMYGKANSLPRKCIKPCLEEEHKKQGMFCTQCILQSWNACLLRPCQNSAGERRKPTSSAHQEKGTLWVGASTVNQFGQKGEAGPSKEEVQWPAPWSLRVDGLLSTHPSSQCSSSLGTIKGQTTIKVWRYPMFFWEENKNTWWKNTVVSGSPSYEPLTHWDTNRICSLVWVLQQPQSWAKNPSKVLPSSRITGKLTILVG